MFTPLPYPSPQGEGTSGNPAAELRGILLIKGKKAYGTSVSGSTKMISRIISSRQQMDEWRGETIETSRRSQVQSSPFRVTFLSPVQSPSALSSVPKGLQIERLTLLVG